MRHTLLATAILLALTSTTGCRIDEHKEGEGENVKIATPFGGMSVKTDDTNVLAGIGLPLYPGATLIKKDKINGKDNGSADVNMSFGSFQLKVKASSYRTSDEPEKVLAFYKKALGRYGNVIQCEGRRPIGTPTHTNEGLACDDNDPPAGSPLLGDSVRIAPKKAHTEDTERSDNSKVELKAGSKKRQHIVGIDPEGSGTKFGLIALELPIDFNFGDKEGRGEKDKQ